MSLLLTDDAHKIDVRVAWFTGEVLLNQQFSKYSTAQQVLRAAKENQKLYSWLHLFIFTLWCNGAKLGQHDLSKQLHQFPSTTFQIVRERPTQLEIYIHLSRLLANMRYT